MSGIIGCCGIIVLFIKLYILNNDFFGYLFFFKEGFLKIVQSAQFNKIFIYLFYYFINFNYFFFIIDVKGYSIFLLSLND